MKNQVLPKTEKVKIGLVIKELILKRVSNVSEICVIFLKYFSNITETSVNVLRQKVTSYRENEKIFRENKKLCRENKKIYRANKKLCREKKKLCDYKNFETLFNILLNNSTLFAVFLQISIGKMNL